MSAKTPLSALATGRRWQTNFLSVLPAVQEHARISFRRLPPEAKQEAIAATIARAFADYGILARRRKLSCAYPGTLAEFAVRRVRAGRIVSGPQNMRDVFNRDSHRLHLQSTSPWDASEKNWRELVLADRRVTPADQAAFNVDFQTWLSQWPPRHRAIINSLASGSRNHEVAVRFRITRGRISQLRRRYEQSWDQFQGVKQAA